MTVLQLKKRIKSEVDLINNEKLLEEVLAFLVDEEKDNNTIDLREFVGTIPFEGDAVSFQRKLRDEWGD